MRGNSNSDGKANVDRSVSRRRYIQAGAAGAAVTLAGCLGGDDDDDNGVADNGEDETTDLVMSIHEEGTGAFAQAQATAAVVNDHTDEIRLDAQPSSSIRENIGRLSRDEADIAFLGDWELANLIEGNEPYEELDVTPHQLYTTLNNAWILITNDEDVETFADLDGNSIAAGTEGEAVDQIVRRLADHYDVDPDFPDVAFADKPGAMSEGIADTVATTFGNFVIHYPWVEQIMAAEDTYVVEWPDGGDALVEDDLIQEVTWTPENMPDFDRVPDGDYISFGIGFLMSAHEDVPEEAISAYLNTMWDNVDSLIEADSAFEFHENLEFWPEVFVDEAPVHPAAETFYEENGIM